ncbi:hypothetical protein NKG05_17690 [Oerskovia sp. M15]
MSYYLDSAVQHVSSACTASERVDTFRVDLASTAPDDAATSLPWYVTGGDLRDTARQHPHQPVPLPTAWRRVVNVDADGTLVGSEVVEIQGRAVATLPRSSRPVGPRA